VSAVSALQECLAAEHAALYGYGVVGSVLSGSSRPADKRYAAASYVAHRIRRDSLSSTIDQLGATAVAAEPVYATPFAVSDVADCRRLARLIEHRTAATYTFAISRTRGDLRQVLVNGLTDAAVREVRWGGPMTAFPGAADL
jgi:Domain of unknown function (DUF4439)